MPAKQLTSLFEFIKSRGVSERNKEQNKLTSLLNIISTLTTIGALSIFILTLIFTEDYIYMAITLSVALIYFVMLILHHFHFIKEAKLYFSTVIPFWYVLTMFAIGGHFSQSIAAASTIVISFLMYKTNKKLRNRLIIFNILLFAIPSIYIGFYDPFFGVREYPLDELVVFLLCLGWISIVFSIYEERNQKYIDILEEKNKILQQQTTELERFTFIASHDLKSPLRNISNFLGLIKRDYNQGNSENINEYLDYAEQGAFQMNKLIKEVLEVSKISYNHEEEIEFIGNKKLLDLNDVLSKSINNLQQEIDQKNAIIETDVLPSLRANESDIQVLFQNLIQNGIKYNQSSSPQLSITLKEKLDHVYLVFKDNGIGIAKKYHDQIFKYFTRLHNQSEFEGTGIGLGLCKKIVDKYGGEIFVKSELDKYSEFHVIIPNSLKPSEPNQDLTVLVK